MTDRYVADVVLPIDDPFSVHAPGFVDVEDGRIAGCGPLAAATPGDAQEHRVGGLLMPGLVNTHAHSAMTVLRGAGEGLPLDRWLGEVIWPREGRLEAEDVRAGMVLGAAEMLLGGVTTTHEMYFFPGAVADGAAEAGIRAVVSAAIVDAPGWERFGTTGEQAVKGLIPRAKYKSFETEPEAALEVINGKADAFVYDLPYCAVFYAQKGAGKLVFLDEPFTFEPLAWAIKQGDPDFMNWLNNFLSQVKGDGRYQKVYSKWITGNEWVKDVQ